MAIFLVEMSQVYKKLENLVGDKYVSTEKPILLPYSRDQHWPFVVPRMPGVVVRPKNEEEVQEIVKIPIDFFIKKINFREQAIDINGKNFPVFYFNYVKPENGKEFTVWGATAYLISTFIERVYGFTMSKLGLERFKLEKIKQIKEYIKYRDQITSKF